MWWKWQTIDLTNRLMDIGGRNHPRPGYVQKLGLAYPGPDQFDYSGDSGNTTTLDHVLSSAGLAPNTTVRDVMDVRSGLVCAEYFYSSDFKVTLNTVANGVLTTINL